MGESQALPVQLEDPRGQRLGQTGIGTATDGGFHERHGRIGERGDGARGLERRGAEAVEARVQELVEVGRDRELLAGSERAASALERACKLEREEGVAARGLPEPDQGRPRERRVEAGAQQLLERAHAQAADLDRSQPSSGTARRSQGAGRRGPPAGRRPARRSRRASA